MANQITKNQKDILINEFENNPIVAKNNIGKAGCQGKIYCETKWEELSIKLNRNGPPKIADSWKKV